MPEKGGPAVMWTPCSPGDEGAEEISLMDLKGDEVLLPPIKQVWIFLKGDLVICQQ